MKKFLLIGMLFACTNVDASINAIESAGLEPVKVGGFSWFTCSDSDNFSTRFTAKNPQGKLVSGTVCCGILKGCTIRY